MIRREHAIGWTLEQAHDLVRGPALDPPSPDLGAGRVRIAQPRPVGERARPQSRIPLSAAELRQVS
jgi:hypothetical protein